MKKHKQLDQSWNEKADKKFLNPYSKEEYLEGVNDFRNRALEALDIFSVLSVDTPVIYNNKVYVSQEDLISLIEGLYAEIKKSKVKNK